MLFTSPAFLFCFLPLLLLAGKIASLSGPAAVANVLLVASVLLYASWDPVSLALLAALVLVNYAFALLVRGGDDPPSSSSGRRSLLLAVALLLNLAPLLWFKYSAFLGETVARLFHTTWPYSAPPLPLGISFYTFIQIAWLVSVYRGEVVPEGLGRHALFSSCFPYVLSGPLVRYAQLGPELATLRGPTADSLTLGFSLFSVGLAKKVLLADTLAPSAQAVFSAVERGWPVTGLEAWLGSLSYTFQLYFDFSGYTDMAIGLGLMLGLQLPENFISPYKSTGIVDFWRRWHITLGLWLRDFLYIPLGGNRRGRLVQYRNLVLTMLIGGAWHGAGVTFILWGALHGLMLSVNHFFRTLIRASRAEQWLALWPARLFCIALTFFCLNLSWVLFRAESLEGALRLYEVMFLGPLASDGASETLAGYLPHQYFQDWLSLAVLGVSAVIVWAFPCSHELFCRRSDVASPWLRFRPTALWAVFLALLSFSALLLLSRTSVFLYFKF